MEVSFHNVIDVALSLCDYAALRLLLVKEQNQ
jgi:hypothetical protein